MSEIEEELRRYQMLRFASRVGFKPPYFYNRSLRNRLYRVSASVLVITGEGDTIVSRVHSETYARLIPGAAEAKVIVNAGHSVHVEQADATACCVLDFLGR
jgi:pimeloyl-ACP methyl ester carboxylesterase